MEFIGGTRSGPEWLLEMEAILPALEQYEAAIYLILGIAALVSLQKVLSGLDQMRGTVFGIERELAVRRFQSGLTALVLALLVALAEFLIVSFVSPSMLSSGGLVTPTVELLATPTSTLAPLAFGDPVESTQVIVTPTPTLPLVAEGCIPGKIEWVFPLPGKTIEGTVKLIGTVNVPNLGFYKYEYSSSGSDVWTTIAANDTQKVNGEIGFWNTTQLSTGDYLLRLVVVDNQNTPFPACVVRVSVVQTP